MFKTNHTLARVQDQGVRAHARFVPVRVTGTLVPDIGLVPLIVTPNICEDGIMPPGVMYAPGASHLRARLVCGPRKHPPPTSKKKNNKSIRERN